MYESLRAAGLTKYEALIYAALVTGGRGSASEIATRAKMPPTAVYPNVKSLVEKKLIVQWEGDVRQFEVLDPLTALPQFIEQRKRSIENVGEQVIEQVRAVRRREVLPAKEVVRLTLGREGSHAIYDRLIGSTKKSFFVMGWRMESIGDKYTWLQRYRSLVRAGVDTRLIVTGLGKKQVELIEAYRKAGVKARFLPLDNFSLVVSDSVSCKITLKGKEVPEKVNVHIDDADLARAMQSYFLSCWRKARS